MSRRDAGHLGGAQPHHPVVVVGVVGDVAGAVGLLDAPEAVLETRRARHGPGSGEGRGIPQVGPERRHPVVGVVGVLRELDADLGQLGDVWDPPGLGAVGQVAVGEQEHRRAVLEGDPCRLDRRLEAVTGGACRDDRHGRLAVAAVHREQQVALFGLGRQSRRGSAALHVDDDERQLQ